MVSKKAPLYTKPASLSSGMVWMEPIRDIMKHSSVDGASKDSMMSWTSLLTMKRTHRHYKNLRKSIERYGFTQPLTVIVHDEGEPDYWGLQDGHHRLAIALDLGMTHVPVIVECDAISIDYEEEENYGMEDFDD